MKTFASALAAAFLCVASAQAAETPNASTQPETVKDRVGLVPTDSNLLLIFMNPGEGQDAALNTFYDQHMREFQNFPETKRMQEFEKITRKDKADPAYKYVFAVEYKDNQDDYLAKIQAALKDKTLGSPAAGIVAKIEGDDYAPTGPGYRKSATVNNARAGMTPPDSRLLIVFANCAEGKDAEFNAYYEKHMQQYMTLFPMFVRVQKFKVLHRQAKGDPEYKYAIVYEYTGDPDTMATAVFGALKDGRLAKPPEGVVTKLEGNDYAAKGVGYRRVPQK